MKRALLAAAMSLALFSTTHAQDYPARPIQIIVPSSAGGPADTVARIVADHLGDELGQRITIVNMPGAAGEIGMSAIADAKADGYTLGIFGYPDNVILELTRQTKLSAASFDYLAGFDSMPMGIYASPTAKFDNVETLRAQMSKGEGQLVVGEAGGLALLAAVAFADAMDIKVTTVNFSGGGESLNALLGNHVDAISTGMMSTEPVLAGGGKLIGFTSADRMAMFPNVPTLSEQGLDLVLEVARVLVAPSGLNAKIRERLVKAVDAISTNASMTERFAKAKLPYRFRTSSEFTAQAKDAGTFYKGVVDNNRAAFSLD